MANKIKRQNDVGWLQSPWHAEGNRVIDANGEEVAVCRTDRIAKFVAAAPRMASHMWIEYDCHETGWNPAHAIGRYWPETREILVQAGKLDA